MEIFTSVEYPDIGFRYVPLLGEMDWTPAHQMFAWHKDICWIEVSKGTFINLVMGDNHIDVRPAPDVGGYYWSVWMWRYHTVAGRTGMKQGGGDTHHIYLLERSFAKRNEERLRAMTQVPELPMGQE